MGQITNSFLALKRKYPKMTDTEAMKKAQNMAEKTVTKVREADATKREEKTKKKDWIGKLTAGVMKELGKTKHSPAVKAGKKTMKKITASRRRLNKIKETAARHKRDKEKAKYKRGK